MANGQPSLGQRVHTWATNHLAQQVGNGECFALADQALRASGARSAADYGEVTADADYVWGSAVQLADVQPGDVLQFRDYEVTIEVTVTRTKTFLDGSTEESEDTTTETYTRPHHTAIVSAKLSGGQLRVLEQNAPPRGSTTPQRVVRRNELHTTGSSSTQTSVRQESDGTVRIETTTTITVTGTIWAYRPQPR
jgi:hypothetical protein